MRHLHKYKLDFSPALKYIRYALENANTMSIELLNHLNFKDGIFFTLLPSDSNIERIYEFESGMVLPQNPEQIYYIAEERNSFSIIPTIREELCELILEEIKSNDRMSCVFDDVLRSPNDNFNKSLILSHGLI